MIPVASRRREQRARAASPAPSVVFLVPGFPAGTHDCTCVPAVQNYISGYAASRPEVNVHVIAFQYPFVRRLYRCRDVTVHGLAGKNRRGAMRIATWIRAMRAFERLHAAGPVEVLHSFWLTECAFVGQLLSRRYRIPHVASIGGQDAREDNPYRRWLRFDGLTVTAGSDFAAEVFAHHTSSPVPHVIPLGLDVASLGRIKASTSRDIDILGVGSLNALKNYSAFVDIVAALIDDFPDIRTCVIGDGPEHAALRGRVTQRNLQRHVELPGRLPRERVFRRLQRSKVFLHTSRYEGQGYVFLEALFAGVPVVCFDVGYTGDNELVYRCDDIRQMTGVIEELLRTPRPLAPQRVPSIDETVAAFEALYKTFDRAPGYPTPGTPRQGRSRSRPGDGPNAATNG